MTSAQSDISKQAEQGFDPQCRLYHFTNSVGLYGILTSQCIWATHYRYLNDTSEFYAAYDVLRKFIESRLNVSLARLKVMDHRKLREDIDKQTHIQTEAEKITRLIYDTVLQRDDGFVFSSLLAKRFEGQVDTAEDQFGSVDSFLHWTAYGRGGGFALEFSPEKLRTLFNEEQLSWRGTSFAGTPAYYPKHGEMPPELEQQFDAIGRFASKIFEESARALDGRTEGHFREIADAFIRILISVKDVFFRGENEYRFAVLRARGAVNAPEVFFRGEGVPYIKILNGFLKGGNSALERIIIGPHPNIGIRKLELRNFLDINGLSGVGVEVSKAPFRAMAFS